MLQIPLKQRLELLEEAFPKVSRVAVLTNPANPEQEARVKETKVAAQGLRVQLQILQVRESSTFDKAFLAINKGACSGASSAR